MLPRHTITAAMLWQVLLGMLLLGSDSLRALAGRLRLPMALESLYGLCRRLRARLDTFRSALSRAQPPPPSTQSDPLRQTIEHLQRVFPDGCAPAEFQLHFQRPFLG